MSGFAGLWVPEPPRAHGSSPWKLVGRKGAQGDGLSLREGCQLHTHLSRLWGLNLAPSQGRAGLAFFLSEENKKVPHTPSACQFLSSTVIKTLLITIYRMTLHSLSLLSSN